MNSMLNALLRIGVVIMIIFTSPRYGFKVFWWVCLSVCPHATGKLCGWHSPNFLCILSVAVARSSSVGVVIHYVLPVLRMASCFHTMGPMGGWTGTGLCSSPEPVDVTADRVRVAAAHRWLCGQACWGASAGLGARYPVSGLGCCRGQWCVFRRVLHASRGPFTNYLTLKRGWARCYTMLPGGGEGSSLCYVTVWILRLMLIFLFCSTSSVLQPTSMCVCSAVFIFIFTLWNCAYFIFIFTLWNCACCVPRLCDTSNSCFNTTSLGGGLTVLRNFGGHPSVTLCYRGEGSHKRPK